MTDLTPMVKQYREIKSRHNDAILFFRLGDFYEMFNDDAILASKELDITLTGRGEGESRMPMCGIPYHAADGYIAKLISRGHKVAICEQVEDPSLAKGIVKRDVVKIITPGAVFEPNILNEKKANWLLAISFTKASAGLALIDASTGEFRATQIKGEGAKEKLFSEIERISPSECLLPDIIPADWGGVDDFLKQKGVPFSIYKDVYDFEAAEEKLKEHFNVASISGFGLGDISASLGAAAAIIEYLKDAQKTALSHINRIKPYQIGEFMFLDGQTRKNLEILETIRDKSFKGSLLWVLDRTKTSMGARLLRSFIMEPLLEPTAINHRLDAVQELFSSAKLRLELEGPLKEISDLERIAGRIAVASANARDLVALKASLSCLPGIKEMLRPCKAKLIKDVLGLNELKDVLDEINNAITDDPPFALKEGGLIKKGYSAELDEIRGVSSGGKQWIAELEASERARTGIKSLKVGFTKVFGYYIEVTNSNLSQVPSDYIRKQTLVNQERFITPSLKERESTILNAEARIIDLEYTLFAAVRGNIAKRVKDIQEISRALALLDVFLSLAEVAIESKYVRPNILEKSRVIEIEDGRHPVVEKMLGEFKFVPNDCTFDGDESRFMLITGPNMAGKSTYMRQIALITLMAQVGSFVPAKKASIGPVDRIFTRIGAMDDIFSGQSTFMLEMTETANILNNATERSLIILDEIGRGTSTFDGMSIAAAVAEYIHNKIGAKTLFATHYHEITQLADKHKGMKNFNVAVKEEGDKITFLHRIAEGPADRSYGIAVAKLAGLSKEVIDRAKEVYNTLEMVESRVGEEKGARGQGLGARERNKKIQGKGAGERNQIGLF